MSTPTGAAILCAAACALPAVAGAATTTGGASSVAGAGTANSGAEAGTADSAAEAGTATASEAPIPVPDTATPPSGRRLSAERVLAIAGALPKMRAVRAKNPGSYGNAYLKGGARWQVSYFSANGRKEIGQVIIADRSGRVLEQWTGFQVAWSMARGYPGAFARHADALYIWLPLCLLFLIPFVDPRRPFSLLHLDLLALLSFSVSLAFFNHAHIYASVPLAYPPLLYLLVRMLSLLRRRSGRAPGEPLRLRVPVPWLAVGVVALLGFRIGLNISDSNVIDVGYAGLIGAQRIVDGKPLYGGYPAANEHGDTYGPVNYEAYVPFEEIFGFSGTWDDLPAAHAAAIVFDLLAVALLFLLGRRVRGPALGVALAYAWVAYPFTLFALDSNTNDTLVAVLVLAALLLASSPPGRGVFTALAGLTKFAPLAIAPLFAAYGLREGERAGAPPGLLAGPRHGPASRLALFLVAFLATAAVVSIPALSHDSLHTIYERTIDYQANRGSPFSVWGLYGGLGVPEAIVQAGAALLAIVLALIPRRPGIVALAAACAAVMIAVQLGVEHWFYLYIPWFFPLVMLALLGRLGEPRPRVTALASGSARSTRPAAGVSFGSALP